MKTFGLITACVLGVMIILGATGLLNSAYRYVTAEWFGIVDAEVQIESGANRRFQYDKFFNLCSEVQAVEDKIDAQNELLDRDLSDVQKNMIITNLSGLQSARADAIRQYNADARKDYTSARFLDNDLPVQLPTAAYNGDNKTKCHN